MKLVLPFVVFALSLPEIAAAQTPTPTPVGSGPRITYFRPVNPDGCEFCCSSSCTRTPTPTPYFDSQGRPIYKRFSGRPLFVVEARRGPANRVPGSNLFPADPAQRPDLQMMVFPGLGTETVEVCDVGPAPQGGGVPGFDPPDFRPGQDVTDALTDLSCRFTVQMAAFPCTKNKFGDFAFLGTGTERQYCFQVPQTVEFHPGFTRVAVQVLDTSGNVGERKEIVVQVGEVDGVGLSGRTHYYRGDRAVPNANVLLLDGSSTSTMTSSTGDFSFSLLTAGNWMLQPEKVGDFGSGISSLDASFVLQNVVGTMPFDAFQELACDTTGNGSISSLDASHILQLVVGKINRLPVAETCASDWVFVPSPDPVANQTSIQPQMTSGDCQRGGISFDPLDSTASGQDFDSILFGDCTGNWQPPGGGGGALAGTATAPVESWLRVQRRARGKVMRGLLLASSDGPIYALDAQIGYDPSEVRVRRVRAIGPARGALLQYKDDGNGFVAIAMASGRGIEPKPGAIVQIELIPIKAQASDAGVWPIRVEIDERPARIRGD